jgi:hypothetical protein
MFVKCFWLKYKYKKKKIIFMYKLYVAYKMKNKMLRREKSTY